MTGLGMTDAMAPGTVDMFEARNRGLDNAGPRTTESTTPTTFRQWCEEALKPALHQLPHPARTLASGAPGAPGSGRMLPKGSLCG
ncbi:hypothetical protein [Streptomyces flavofungini]|uniref:hypothetical protein n=1 Tax=Streptomyces flavofungini TaxID=68200 RepID=UPI0025B055E4|nr:hypothetical protein [Streptomyces flavofungini]WJV44588.1 hypothetical protein QUY26_03000 [Streptomyces flavofungini]